MNIFILDYALGRNVSYYVDKHIIKMQLESVQLLSTASHLVGQPQGYEPTHEHHPCTKWLLKSRANWMYLRSLAYLMQDEWRYRWNHQKTHKSIAVLDGMVCPDLPRVGLTRFAMAMPDKYRGHDVVDSYRRYYAGEKRHLFKWTRRDRPWWLDELALDDCLSQFNSPEVA